MPNVSSFGAQTDNAVVSGTVTDRQMIIPEVPPQGLMSVGPRVTPNFIKEPWNKLNSYNFFDVVKDSAGSSYIAIKPVVPTDTELTDEEFWFKWSDPDAQLNELNEIVKLYDRRISQNASAITEEVARAKAAEQAEEQRATAAEATKAPVNHASEETIYGIGNEVNYGHLKLAADDTPMTSGANDGIAATPSFSEKIATKHTEFIKPEQFGAVGDGVTDDTEAFKKMIATLDNESTVMFSRQYLVRDTLVIDKNEVLFMSYGFREYMPGIIFDCIQGIHVTGFGFTINGLNLKTKNKSQSEDTVGIFFDGSKNNGNIDATIRNSSGSYFKNFIKTNGRNILVNECLCTSDFNSIIQVINDGTTDDLRGYRFINSRKHGTGTCIFDTTNIGALNAANGASFEISNCFIDGAGGIYRGIIDGFALKNNMITLDQKSNITLCYFTEAINDNAAACVANNYFYVKSGQVTTTYFNNTKPGKIFIANNCMYNCYSTEVGSKNNTIVSNNTFFQFDHPAISAPSEWKTGLITNNTILHTAAVSNPIAGGASSVKVNNNALQTL